MFSQYKKNSALVALLAAIFVQLLWTLIGLNRGPGILYSYPSVITMLFGSLIFTRGKFRWVNSLLRILLGLIFTLSVGDRFGLMGSYGTPGVSWGDFDHFISYTAQVNSFLPRSFASVLAITATAAELIIGAALVLGLFIKIVEVAASVLLVIFGLAMFISFGLESQFYYAVFVLSASAWFLSKNDNASFSFEAAMKRYNEL